MKRIKKNYKWGGSDNWLKHLAILLLLFIPILAKFLAVSSTTAVGCDTSTHIYKAIILKEQMQKLPPTLWGVWDWNWYAGYPFCRVYAPLFYYIASSISLILNISIETWVSIMLPLTFLLSGLSMFILTRHMTKDMLASIFASIAYTYFPYHIANLSVYGSLGSLTAFIFGPLAFYFTTKISDGKDIFNISAASIMISLSILSNQVFGLLTFILMSLFVIFKGKKTCLVLLTIEVFLLTAFWIIPYIPYLKQAFLPVRMERDFLVVLKYILTENTGILTLIIFIFILTMFYKNETLKGYLSKNKDFRIMLVIFILLVVYVFFTYLFPLPILSAFTLGRTMYAFTLIIPIIGAFAIAGLEEIKMKKVIAVILIAIAIIEGIFVTPIYYPINTERYSKAYHFISTKKEWFRAFLVPREPAGALIPLFSGKPIIDGWFDQGSPLARVVHFISDETDYSGKPINNLLITNPDKALTMLGYLGVKYLIVDLNDPIYGPEFSGKLYNSIFSSNKSQKVYQYDSITIFELETFSPLTFGVNATFVESDEEVLQSITFEGGNTVLLYDEQEELLPTHSERMLQYEVISIRQLCDCIEYKFKVNQPVVLAVPISYDEALKILINNTDASFYKAPPGIIVIPIEHAGNYTIKVMIAPTISQLYSSIVSLISFVAIFIILSVPVFMRLKIFLQKSLAFLWTKNSKGEIS